MKRGSAHEQPGYWSERHERDAQRFWLSVVEGLRSAVGSDGLVQKLEPTPEFDGDSLVRRLISELEALDEPVVLVIDDLHELGSPDAQAQLELLLAHRPRLLYVVLATRHDPSLGLHRLRLAGELTELRAADLRLSAEEARQLLDASGVELSAEAAAMLLARTEGWAAGLRLATMSLAGHPDPGRFVAEFAGSERTVADYLLAEVLVRQPEGVRQLLLRTSILERVCGPLADRLTGASGSERMLIELEDSNAFVVSVDRERSWFRYHPLFADLLVLELRRSEPDAIGDLHLAAADWLAEHGHAVDAIRHAQAAGDWERAGHLLADHGLSLSLDGQVATIGALLAAFPADALSHPELAALLAFVELTQHSLDTAAAYIALAERHASEVLAERQRHFAVVLAIVRLELARRRGDLESALREVGPLLEPVEADSVTELTLGNDARAVALMNLGIVELWSFRLDDAERHLEQGLALARLIDRPFVQIGCLSHLAVLAARSSLALARQRSLEAIAIAEAHGWATDPIACTALAMMASADAAQGRFEEGSRWLGRAEHSIRAEPDPATALFVHFVRGELHVCEGRLGEALGDFRAAARLQDVLATSHALTGPARVSIAQTQLRMGDVTGARATVARLTDRDHEFGEARTALAALRLADGDHRAAIEVLAPVLDGTAPVVRAGTVIQALILDALARDQLGDRVTAERDIERALDIAEPDSLVFPLMVVPARDLLERHPRHRTAHAALLADLLSVLGGSSLPPRGRELATPSEPLSESELRVLRFLPSNLSAGEIAGELYVSTSTVKTHMRHIYEKLDAHRRTEAVDRARDAGAARTIGAIGSLGRPLTPGAPVVALTRSGGCALIPPATTLGSWTNILNRRTT